MPTAKKALALLLKPASPTPSNTGSLRSFQRDIERGTKVMRYWEVLQRGGANECLWATRAPRVTRAGTYGKGNTALKGCIGLLLTLNSMYSSATDRRWARLQSKTPRNMKHHVIVIYWSSNREVFRFGSSKFPWIWAELTKCDVTLLQRTKIV